MLAAVLAAVAGADPADRRRAAAAGARRRPPGARAAARAAVPVAALRAGLAEVAHRRGRRCSPATCPFLTAALVAELRARLTEDGVLVVDDGGRDQYLLGVWRTAALRAAAAGARGPTPLRRVLAPLAVTPVPAGRRAGDAAAVDRLRHPRRPGPRAGRRPGGRVPGRVCGVGAAMRIAIAGAHGQVARRLGRLLSGRGDTVVGIVRNPAHEPDLDADGVEPVVLDLEPARSTRSPRWWPAPTRSSSPRAPARAAAPTASTPSTGARRCCSPTPRSGPVSARTCWSPRWASSRRRRATPGRHGPGLRRLPAGEAAPPRTTSCRGRVCDTTIVRPGRLTDEPGHRAGHPRHGSRARGACPGTTSPPSWPRSCAPAKTATVVELVGGADTGRRGGRRPALAQPAGRG